MKHQKTIKGEAKLSGRGLFGGEEAKVVFRPAPDDTGVVFIRADVEDSPRVRAIAPNLTESARRTTLKKGSASIDTVEHCLAAVAGLEIDNLFVEVDGPEMPAPDASAAAYVQVLKRAGLVEQQASRKEFIVREPVAVSTDEASIFALPAEGSDKGLSITFDLDYAGHTGIGRQTYGCRVTPEIFERNLAPARTFLLEAEARQFQARGIGRHIGPKDVLVIDSDGPIRNSYRFPNECVRHKIVDLIGDLVLVGRPLCARIVAHKSGHTLNQHLVHRLYQPAQRQDRIEKQGTEAILDIRRIQKILPHRYPFLLVDRIVEIEGDTRIKGIKNVTYNELFFQGHFPTTPIMPGVLILEALAQVSGLLFAQRLEHTGKLGVILSMDGVKFRRAVVPGDQLVLCAETVRLRRRTAHCKCTAWVGDAVAAEAEVKFMLIDELAYQEQGQPSEA
ncbi:MAG: UDP-3-O-[3-hydroxymyristoyl] N-acetylglucosamine deacetylase [Phycisphaerae bacterium]|nr:UDP-3-O-[3-hydroxymyristoyl] N-acetylglucosamine deacetylase [Phycisphaerae bacterium]